MSSLLLSSYLQKVYDENDKRIGYLYEELWTEYASSLLGKVFLFSALFLAVALIVVGVFVRKKKAENMPAFLKTAATVAVTFALTVIVTMLAIGFGKIGEKGYMSEKPMLLVLVPPMILAAIAVLGGVATYIAFLYSKKAGKTALNVTFGALAAALIAAFVCLLVYFNRNVKNDGYYDTADGSYGTVNQLILYVAAALLIIVALAAAFLTDKNGTFSFNSKSLALAGVCVSLSFALSYIKLWDLPQGGSVTLVSLLPVMLFSYLCGTKKGVFVGLVYGLLQSLQDPYIIHPAQFLLDYPVAFAMAGLAGALKNVKLKLPQIKFALGALTAGIMRYISHTVSGVFAFSAYAIDAGATNAFVYSAAYNSFVFIDVLLVIVAGVLLFSSKAFVAETKKFDVLSRPEKTADGQNEADATSAREK
ncbi:MAG: energy-coupled thiamine transporter ThiT [Candidatus Borkfalkiaceae bacterium]|nr:energy-coupled thiamine transporter ThiT [Clostridia bacterium]MDY6223958.1 energy-coupled thiamine transporter ThiT [Christensenellaceae bacterium]